MWGYGGLPSQGRIAGGQRAYRCGRLFPVAPSEAGATADIRPYCVPWTPTADQWGVAFPAGLVGIVTTANLPSPLTGDLDADFATKWADLSGGSSMVGVPGVLPVGYNIGDYVPWQTTAWDLANLPSASGWTTQTWLPTSSPNGISRGPLTLVGSGGTTGDPPGYMLMYPGQMTGFRKVQYKLRSGQAWLTMPTYDQTMKVSHNANGTNPGSALGDTVDATSHVTDADFVNVSSFIWSTNWIDLGQIIASSIGTMTYFSLQTDSSASPFSLANGVTIEFRLSPRMDVPYPVSVMGQGDLIAPGGYP